MSKILMTDLHSIDYRNAAVFSFQLWKHNLLFLQGKEKQTSHFVLFPYYFLFTYFFFFLWISATSFF